MSRIKFCELRFIIDLFASVQKKRINECGLLENGSLHSTTQGSKEQKNAASHAVIHSAMFRKLSSDVNVVKQ